MGLVSSRAPRRRDRTLFQRALLMPAASGARSLSERASRRGSAGIDSTGRPSMRETVRTDEAMFWRLCGERSGMDLITSRTPARVPELAREAGGSAMGCLVMPGGEYYAYS